MKIKYALILLLVLAGLVSCNKGSSNNNNTDDGSLTDNTNVMGYGILSKWPGIWDGPVNSNTALGSFPEWIVDMRPISEAQVSGKSELDTINDIFMSFFICKYDGKYKMAFRNGGGFAGLQRISYQIIDSVIETPTQAYYRFADVKAGEDRVYAEFLFQNDSVYMQVYTNKYNTVSPPVLHMQWRAGKVDTSSTQDAITAFNFPQKKLVRDFSTAFDGLTETVFYNTTNDPYKQEDHPYLGNSTITATLGSSVTTQASGKVILVISTQPLFNGFILDANNLRYRSRYIYMNSSPFVYTFDYMHPDTYYINAFYDSNGDGNPGSGEYLSSPFDQSFTLSAKGTASKSVEINYQIP